MGLDCSPFHSIKKKKNMENKTLVKVHTTGSFLGTANTIKYKVNMQKWQYYFIS